MKLSVYENGQEGKVCELKRSIYGMKQVFAFNEQMFVWF